MKLTEIESGSKVFVDSNIFIYHFTGVSNECSDFLARGERGELTTITGIHVILDVLHSLMMVEAVRKHLVEPPGIAEKLKKAPQTLKLLNEYYVNTEKIPDMGVIIQPLVFETLVTSHVARLSYGLLVYDSMIIAGMKQDRINLLATNNDVFRNVSEIQMCTPGDITLS